MKRLLSLILTIVLLGAGDGTAADRPAGTWRMTVELGGGQTITVLLSFDSQNGQWTGKCLGATADLGKENTVDTIRVAGDRLRFTIVADGQSLLNFDGRFAAQGPIRGSIIVGSNLLLTTLEPTQLTKFDRFELLKEVVGSAPTTSVLFESTVDLLRHAGANKAKPEEVRAWTEKVIKAAEAYGDRFLQTVAMRVVEVLTGQPEYVAVALAQAQRAERLLEPNDDIAVQMPILDALAKLLVEANKPEEAKEVQTRVSKLEERDYQEFVKKFPFKPDAFAGRKAKTDRAVLLELFTGSQCPPCVAADLAFDALGMAYKPADVILLQYHLHIPGPDPMTNPASEARAQYYRSQIQGTPTTLFNGKEQARLGGSVAAAKAKFLEYKGVIDPLLETPPRAKIQLTVRRDGDKITANAKVTDLSRPSDKVRLRLALAEEVVRYLGGNGMPYHHHVVRAFFGGPDGFPLKPGSPDQPATISVDEVRGSLNAYLDKFVKENDGITFPERPLGLRKLVVVAFVQDDANQEVLQVVQAEVK